MWKGHVPRRIRAILPVRSPRFGATAGLPVLHASAALVGVPVLTIGADPAVGIAPPPAAAKKPTFAPPVVVKYAMSTCVFSYDATPITLRPTPGALAE